MGEEGVPDINEDSCTGCGACEDVCRVEAISMVDRDLKDSRRSISERVARIDANACIRCDDCVGACEDISWPKQES